MDGKLRSSMASGRELLNQFKAAAWKDPAEVEAFVASAEAPQTPELLKMLEIVSSRDGAAQRSRLSVFSRLIEKNPDRALFVPFVKAMKGAEPTLLVAQPASGDELPPF